jgi:hypothetical protein
MAIDFSAQYGSQQYSDLELVLYEETEEGPLPAGSKAKVRGTVGLSAGANATMHFVPLPSGVL